MNAELPYFLCYNHDQQRLSFFQHDGTLLQCSIDVYNHKDGMFDFFFDTVSMQKNQVDIRAQYYYSARRETYKVVRYKAEQTQGDNSSF